MKSVPEKQANTTALIRAWSMDGVESDLDGFHSVLDIHALVAGRSGELEDVVTAPELPPLLLKQADDDDWLPLQVALPTSA